METKIKDRGWVKNVAIVFLAVMLVLTFFSNTIMNRSLPEVATQSITSNTITAQVRGTGKVSASQNYEVKIDQTRTVKSVMVKVGQEVNTGDVLFVLADMDSDELEAAQDSLRALSTSYQKALINATESDYAKENRDIQRARENLEEAEKKCDSLNVSDLDLAMAETGVSVAKDKVRDAQKRVDNAQEDLDDIGGKVEPDDAALRSLRSAMNAKKSAWDAAEDELETAMLIYGTEYNRIKEAAEVVIKRTDEYKNKSDSARKAYLEEKIPIYMPYVVDRVVNEGWTLPLSSTDADELAYLIPDGERTADDNADEPEASGQQDGGNTQGDDPSDTGGTDTGENSGGSTDSGSTDSGSTTGGNTTGGNTTGGNTTGGNTTGGNTTGSGTGSGGDDNKNDTVSAEARKYKTAYDEVTACQEAVESARTEYENTRDQYHRALDNDNSGEYGSASRELKKAQELLKAAQEQQTESEEHLEKLKSKKTDYDTAAESVKSCQITLEDLLFALQEQQKADNKNAQLEKLDLQDLAAQVGKAQKRVNELAEDTVDKEIKAEVPGIIESIGITAGNKTTPDVALATIELPDMGYTMSFSVTNEQARLIHTGDSATVSNYYYGSEVIATVASVKTDPKNPQTSKLVTFDVTGDVNVGADLTVSVGQRSQEYDFVVPNSSLRSDTNGDFVLVITAKNSPLGNRYIATRVDVTKIASDDTNTAVTGALNRGDFVITTSTKPIENGQQVRMQDS